MRLLCALGLFLALLHVTSCLLIGAFNIQQFGQKKTKDKAVMNIIKKIVLRYDIILIQEVIDKDLTATKRLMDLVNNSEASSVTPLGPSTYRERYLFLYRYQNVSVTGWFQYDEDKAGNFMRPPFVVQFSSTETAVKEFVLIPIHTKPGKAVKEIDALVDVVKKAKLKWMNNNIMVLGDFNAGGTYVKDENRKYKGDWEDIRLFTNKDFHWLIKDNVDTTVLGSPKAYDRIVVTTDMNKGVVPDSARGL
ncbi:Deoxyribonuclease-1 [Dissostichus eleginoides]|uniref:Deoxyribonuclease-1 n=1 Tax=Dissostichus eleginoides TaxID=100907 RepID=A0AAD9B7S0_DISEL|nr:Deoxyribonuclease-1 [Dissostichus eleginoides]